MATTRATPRKAKRPASRKPKADTRAVVGNAAEEPDIPARWREHFRKLTNLRDQLSRERRQLVSQAGESKHRVHADNMADAGTDSFEQDVVLGIASSDQEALFEVEEALNRIKTGRYGICEATGKPIDPARLQAIPWTRFSLEAERNLEAKNEVSRAGLGELRDVAHSSEPSPDDKDAPDMEG